MNGSVSNLYPDNYPIVDMLGNWAKMLYSLKRSRMRYEQVNASEG